MIKSHTKQTESKEGSEKQPKKIDMRKLIVILIIFVGLLVLLKGILYVLNKKADYQEEIILKKDIQINLGEEFILESLFKSKPDNLSRIEFSIKNLTDENLGLTTIYYNNKNETVLEDEALEKGILKEGYTKKEFFDNLGDYEISIKYNDEVYQTIVTIDDLTKPTLKLKELTINYGTEVNISDFVESCTDNSKVCTYVYLNDGGEETESIPFAVGEHLIRIQASDASGNKEILETKLVIKTEESTTTKAPANKTTTSKITTSKVTTSKVTTTKADTSGYDTTNARVKAALDMVGMTGKACTWVAEAALRATGQTLWVEYLNTYRNNITWKGIKATPNNKAYVYSDHSFVDTSNDYYVTSSETNLKHKLELTYFTNNNIIYNFTATNCPADRQDYCNELEVIFAKEIGKEAYHLSYMEIFNEGNIKYVGTQIPISSIVPGDFLYYEVGTNGTTHIAVYIGNNKAVHGGMGGSLQEVRIMGLYLTSHPKISAWRVPYNIGKYRIPDLVHTD